MPLILPGNVASATAAAYEVANSCRFNDGDSAYMHKTPGGAGNLRTWTFSIWFKRSAITSGAQHKIFSVAGGGSNNFECYFNTNDTLAFYHYSSDGGVTDSFLGTNQVFRDPSAFYHLVLAVDTTQAVDSNRVKMYVNGEQVTSFSSALYFDQNYDTYVNSTAEHRIGANLNDSQYFDGYMSEVVFIDGTQYAASDFGEFDEDSPTIWKPIDVSGLTFGTNGFYLDFEASDNLGNDANGGTDLTEVNLDATDQATDTPTNNFCTLNPLSADEMTFAEGNCKVTQASAGPRTDDNARGTMGVSSGKWYWEVKVSGGTVPVVVGICFDKLKMGSDLSGLTGVYAIQNASATNAYKRENGTTAETSGFTNPVNDNIINVAFDADNAKLYIGINGTYENQAGSTGDPAAGSNETFSSIDTSFFWLPWIESRGASQVAECNFGGCPAFSISSGNADANGYGNMEYEIPDGYYCLCSKNLAEYG